MFCARIPFHPKTVHGSSGTHSHVSSGQAMVESILVILAVSLLFFGLFQYAQLFTAKTVLSHAAARAARARAVGFNEWMVRKSALVAAIPASGKRLAPSYVLQDGSLHAALAKENLGDLLDVVFARRPPSAASGLEVNRVPDFMESVNQASSQAVLDYEYWEQTDVDLDESLTLHPEDPSLLSVRVRQRHPLLFSLSALEEGELRSVPTSPDGTSDDELAIAGEYSIENHFPLYLEDAKW